VSETLRDITEFGPFVDGLDHPECVTWGPDGYVYAGGEAGQVYRVSLDGGDLVEVGTTGGFLLGICLDADLNVYGCDSVHRAVMRVAPDGTSSVYSDGDGTRRMVNPNYPVFDASGNLYVSDSGGWKQHDGCVFVIRPGGATELLSDQVTAFPNGIALDPDGRYLYVVVSQLPGVVRIPVADGRATGPVEEVVRLERQLPDGIAFDAEGTLYIACYSPDVILRVSSDGRVEKLAEDWERVIFASPTNIAFCGPERRTLVVASLCRWHLTKGEMPVPGAPYNYPALQR
jgi:gluconolactonase